MQGLTDVVKITYCSFWYYNYRKIKWNLTKLAQIVIVYNLLKLGLVRLDSVFFLVVQIIGPKLKNLKKQTRTNKQIFQLYQIFLNY